MILRKTHLLTTATVFALFTQVAHAQDADTPDADAAAAQDSGAQGADAAPASGEIFVTARRTSEDIQKVPVSITALGAEQLRSAGITKVSEIAFGRSGPQPVLQRQRDQHDLQHPRHGARLARVPAARGDDLRQRRADHGLWRFAANLRSSDIQVLKGPQGTLFGRNSEAGAILANTRAPSYDLNGYVDGLVGDYSWMKVEGALNIPIVAGSAGDQGRRQCQPAGRL